MPTQLDRIEAAQKQILDGLRLKEQLDRIESGMAEIAAHRSGDMTAEQEAGVTAALRETKDRLAELGKEQS